jgi:hypothetical protein
MASEVATSRWPQEQRLTCGVGAAKTSMAQRKKQRSRPAAGEAGVVEAECTWLVIKASEGLVDRRRMDGLCDCFDIMGAETTTAREPNIPWNPLFWRVGMDGGSKVLMMADQRRSR